MRDDAITGVTSNPTIFQKAISQGERYDEQLTELLERETDPREVFIALAARDITDACDLLRDVWDEGKGLRGYVSMEVDPTVAYAKLAYQNWKEVFSGERWEFLASKGASKQWCLWASTSTKNPDYPDTLYVDKLIGPDTVNTMPEETIVAFQDHGAVELTLEK